MNRFRPTLLAVLLSTLCATAQPTIHGSVVDETGQPVAGATVFFSNTSVGTTANGKGVFALTIAEGKYELIVSSIGYETASQTVNTALQAEPLLIRLRPKAKELETVVLEPFEAKGWEKWGRFFLDNFIGTTAEARQCTIRNKEVIKFRHSKERGELTAIGLEPLVIENKALGYRIRYQLEDFTYTFKTRYLYYGGYPLFEELDAGGARERRWEKARQHIYNGSMLHFMRSLYTNTLAQNSFEVYRLVKIPNTEKLRVKAARLVKPTSGHLPADTLSYYDRIMRQEDSKDIVGNTRLNGDSIAYAVDSVTAGLSFPDYLLVVYTKGQTQREFQAVFPDASRTPLSQITLPNGRPIEVQANGNYYLPADLLSTGYWAWTEKISTMLPFDYKPER